MRFTRDNGRWLVPIFFCLATAIQAQVPFRLDVTKLTVALREWELHPEAKHERDFLAAVDAQVLGALNRGTPVPRINEELCRLKSLDEHAVEPVFILDEVSFSGGMAVLGLYQVGMVGPCGVRVYARADGAMRAIFRSEEWDAEHRKVAPRTCLVTFRGTDNGVCFAAISRADDFGAFPLTNFVAWKYDHQRKTVEPLVTLLNKPGLYVMLDPSQTLCNVIWYRADSEGNLLEHGTRIASSFYDAAHEFKRIEYSEMTITARE